MSDQPLTCPFCNARQPVTPGLVPGERLICDRCGETFTVTHVPSILPPPDTTQPPLPVPAAKPVRANRIVAGLVLGVMAIMAGIGLTYALMTVQTRRDHDRALPRKPRYPWRNDPVPAVPDEAVSPAQLEALGYLPPSTGVVVGLHAAELLAGPAAKELRDRGFPVGNVAVSLDRLREWTGLTLEEVDHAVLGVAVRDSKEADLTPPVHLVVRTRRKYDPSRVRLALKAGRPQEIRLRDGSRRTVLSGSLGELPVTLWLADERTVILGLFSNLEEVPGSPVEAPGPLGPSLRRVIEKRLTAGVPAWVAGHSADWKKTWLPSLLATRKEVPVLSRLEQVRTFALWLVPGPPVKLAGAFQCKDEAAARRIAEGDLAPRQKEQPERIRYSQEGEWLDVQMTLGEKGGDGG